MHALWYQRLLTLIILICGWLIVGAFSPLFAQMTATINSLADDANAHPWDDPNTPQDESMDGVCEDLSHRATLRAALEEATNMGVSCNVTINLSGVLSLTEGTLYPPNGSILHGSQLTTIRGSGSVALPLDIFDNTTIRGLKFSGGTFILRIEGSGNTIAGNYLDSATDAIGLYGSGNTIGGSTLADRNIITRVSQNGITITGDNNVIIGNYIGINAQGDTAGNQTGVFVVGDNNVVGGTGSGQRNVISGNHVAGIAVSTFTGIGLTTILGNYIGTDPTSTQKRPNGYGIQVLMGSALIGGGTPSEMNVISGNTNGGIETRYENLGVTILGNHIGLDASGTVAVGNSRGIILSPGSFDVLVENNLISRNDVYGIEIRGLTGIPSVNHRIRGNEITQNAADGILIAGNATDIVVGSSLTQDFQPNKIQLNGAAGVAIYETPGEIPRANTIRKNDFLDNHIVGIDIGGNVQDVIRPPTIQNYTDLGGGAATVTVTHHRIGSLIDVYAAERNTGLTYEGRRWLGSGFVQDSNVAFTFPIDACNCTHLVATATDQAENTSSFTTTGFLVDVREEPKGKPDKFSLENAYPNPFNPTTTINYQLPALSHTTIVVYDLLGSEIATLVNGVEEPGYKSVQWDASGAASGVYFYRLQAGNFVETKRLVVLK